jgi:hypothetical protein
MRAAMPTPTTPRATQHAQAHRRPEFADTQPDMSAVKSEPAQPTALTRLKQDAKPFLIGAGVGATVGIALAALTIRRPSPAFALFPEPKSKVFARVAKIALLAIGRTLLHRAMAHAAERITTEPA